MKSENSIYLWLVLFILIVYIAYDIGWKQGWQERHQIEWRHMQDNYKAIRENK